MRYFRKLKRKLFLGAMATSFILSSCNVESDGDIIPKIIDGVMDVVTSDEAKQAADETANYAKSLVSDENKEKITETAEEAIDDVKDQISDAVKDAIKEKADSIADKALDQLGSKSGDSDNEQALETGGFKTVIAGNEIWVPYYSGDNYIELNGNKPFFSNEELTAEPFENYSELDNLGRCGTAYANICTELMPTEERQSIGSIKPTGWVQNKYDSLKNADNTAGYLYCRCHLIGFQLAGENANRKNLITGTRHFNTMNGMEQFENMVAEYVKQGKDNERHVLYRVTPVFEEADNLLATGIVMEAQSVEDNAISFCVFVYNVEPGIGLDYTTGENWQE